MPITTRRSAARTSYRESSDDEGTEPEDVIPNYGLDEDSNSDRSEEDDNTGDDVIEKDSTDIENCEEDEDEDSLKDKTEDGSKAAVTQGNEDPMEKTKEKDGKKTDKGPTGKAKKATKSPKKKAAKSLKKKGSTTIDDSSPPGNSDKDCSEDPPVNVCPHCEKEFTSRAALRNHTKKFVCRKKKQSTPASKKQANKKFRGKESDRTCPRCKRVFTSLLGFQYHRDRKVCEKGNKQAKGVRPFYELNQGQQFTTKYGIVEVIRDDRQCPTAPPITDLQSKLKLYTSRKTKREIQLKKRLANAHVDSITRRRILSAYYGKHGISREHVHDAYNLDEHGKPRIPEKSLELPPSLPPDPTTPEDSFPDRIVECKWISDARPREDGESSSLMTGGSTDVSPGTLYLQRRLLMTPYSADTRRIYCPLCWQFFLSKSGYRHHYDARSCQVRAEKAKAEKERVFDSIEARSRNKIRQRFLHDRKLLKTILDDCSSDDGDSGYDEGERHANKFVYDGEVVEKLPPVLTSSIARKGKPEKVKAVAIEPLVSPALTSSNARKGKPEKVKAVKPLKPKAIEPLVSPDLILMELQSEFQLLQGRLIGPVYPEVWKSLGYKKPRKKRRKKSEHQDGKKCSKVEPSFDGDIFGLMPVTKPDGATMEAMKFSLVSPSTDIMDADDQKPTGVANPGNETVPTEKAPPVGLAKEQVRVQHVPLETATPIAQDESKDTGEPVHQCLAFNDKLPGKSATATEETRLDGNEPSAAASHASEILSSKDKLVADAVRLPKDYSSLPPMIDIRVFIGEVDSGRYPSMKRYYGTHDDVCVICRSKNSAIHADETSRAAKLSLFNADDKSRAGQLLPCTYCRQAVHFDCVGSRFTLKFPESNEEFMCHHCISTVCQRRRRAEKRRLEKLGLEVPEEKEENEQREKRLKRAARLIPGEEFECVSEQGKRCEDLGVLLDDARCRLDMSLKIARGNDGRKQLIQQMEKVQLE